MRISELAARSGVPASTLRYYESEGLLSPTRSGNGYRVFTTDDLDRLEFIRSVKQLGLEIPEIRSLIDVTEHGSCTAVRESIRPMLSRQLDEVERRIASLSRLRDQLTVAYDRVTSCPDSDRFCRSECAFIGSSCSRDGQTAPTGTTAPAD